MRLLLPALLPALFLLVTGTAQAATLKASATDKEYHLAKTAAMEAVLKLAGDQPVQSMRIVKCEHPPGDPKLWQCTAMAEIRQP